MTWKGPDGKDEQLSHHSLGSKQRIYKSKFGHSSTSEQTEYKLKGDLNSGEVTVYGTQDTGNLVSSTSKTNLYDITTWTRNPLYNYHTHPTPFFGAS
jgi:6-phosphogluconolactonase (cycloisomerase 2 family)